MEVSYKTLVRPKLEYAAPIWHHETPIGQVEKVQRTDARWTCSKGERPVAICLGGNSGDPQEAVFLNLLLKDSLRYSVSR